MSLSRSKELNLVALDTARRLRKEQTPAERILWDALRNRKLNGRKFLRQHPILVEFQDKETFFVADFYCAADRLVIELDGAIHEAQADQDRQRDDVLGGLGLRVLRIKNQEVEEDLGNALKKIGRAFNRTHPLTPPLFPKKERGTGGELG